MAEGNFRPIFSTSSLHDICLGRVIEEFDSYSPEMLSLLPPVQRKQLLLLCPVISICRWEQSCAFDGINSETFWNELLERHMGNLGSYRDYDINSRHALDASYSSNREKYLTFLTAMIFSGDRFSGHYALFAKVESDLEEYEDYYEWGANPDPEKRSCPKDVVNYLVAYKKPKVVNVDKEEIETVPDAVDWEKKSDNVEYYPVPIRDVILFSTQYTELYTEATKDQHVHSRYLHFTSKENRRCLCDEDAVSLLMNECQFYPKRLFIHEYEWMRWKWSGDDLRRLLTQFFCKLESLSLAFRRKKGIDGYGRDSAFEEILLVLDCCLSSPLLSSVSIGGPVSDNRAGLILSSSLATKGCPSLKVLNISSCTLSDGATRFLEAIANVIASHSQLAEVCLHFEAEHGVAYSDTSLSHVYDSLIGFVKQQEFSKLVLHCPVPGPTQSGRSQLLLLLDTFFKTPCSHPQQVDLLSVVGYRSYVPVDPSDTTGSITVPCGALEYKSFSIDKNNKISAEFCEWLFSYQPLVLKAFHFDARLAPFVYSPFPIHVLSENTSFQTSELTLPLFDYSFNQHLQNILHRQQLTKLTLEIVHGGAMKPCDINAITSILSVQKEHLTELTISTNYIFGYFSSFESSTDTECFGDTLYSLRNCESFSLCISIIWHKKDASYIDGLYKSWLNHGCRKLKTFEMGLLACGFDMTEELSEKVDKMGLLLSTWPI